MRHTNNLSHLEKVMFDLEKQELLEALARQKWDYTFPDNRPEITCRDGEEEDFAPFLAQVERITSDNETESVVIHSTRISLKDKTARPYIFHITRDAVFPGEIHKLVCAIPFKYLVPETLRDAWEFFKGNHEAVDGYGEKVKVMVCPDEHTVRVASDSNQETISGREADEYVYQMYEQILEGKKTQSSAIQEMVDYSGVLLPF